MEMLTDEEPFFNPKFSHQVCKRHFIDSIANPYLIGLSQGWNGKRL